MAFSLRNLFRRDASEEAEDAEGAPAGAAGGGPVFVPVGQAMSAPAAAPVNVAVPAGPDSHSPFQPGLFRVAGGAAPSGSPGVSNNRGGAPFNLAVSEGFTVRELSILLPAGIVRQKALPEEQLVELPLAELEASFQQGRPSLRLSQIAAACPGLFVRQVEASEDMEVVLPYQKVKRMLESGARQRSAPAAGNASIPPAGGPAAGRMGQSGPGAAENVVLSPLDGPSGSNTPNAAGFSGMRLPMPEQSGYALPVSPAGTPPRVNGPAGAPITPFNLTSKPPPLDAPAAGSPRDSSPAASFSAASPPAPTPSVVPSGTPAPSSTPVGPSPFRLKEQPHAEPPAIPSLGQSPPAVTHVPHVPAVSAPPNPPAAPAWTPPATANAPQPGLPPGVAPITLPAIPARMESAPQTPSFPLTPQSPPVIVVPPVTPALPPQHPASASAGSAIAIPHVLSRQAPPSPAVLPAAVVAPSPPPAAHAVAAAPVMPLPEAHGHSAVRDLTMSLASVLRSLTTAELGFDPANVPATVTVTFPIDLIRPQLAAGKVMVSIEDVARGVAEKFRPAFSKARRDLAITLPMSEVFHALPASALPRPATPAAVAPPAAVPGGEMPTPFSMRAKEDAALPHPQMAQAAARQHAEPGVPGLVLPPLLLNHPAQKPAAPAAPPIEFPGSKTLGLEPPAASEAAAPASPATAATPPTAAQIASPIRRLPAAAPAATNGLRKGVAPAAQYTPPPKPVRPPPAIQPGHPAPESTAASVAAGFPPAHPTPPAIAAAAPAPAGEMHAEPPATGATDPPSAPDPIPASGVPSIGADDLGVPRSAKDLTSAPPPGIVQRQNGPAPASVAAVPPPSSAPPPVSDPVAARKDAPVVAAPAKPAAPAPAPAASDGRDDLTFGYHHSPKQIALRAIFNTDQTLSSDQILELSSQLPGIHSCLLLTAAGATQHRRTAEDEETRRFSESASQTYQSLRSLAESLGMGGEGSFTLKSDRGVRSFFMEKEACLAVLHADAAFHPGVREKLILVARDLSQMAVS